MDAYRSLTEDTQRTSLQIRRGSVARIQNGRGMLLSVQDGGVWITQSGSTKDVCLDAGESFRIDRDGLTLVSSVGRAPQALVNLTRSNRITRWAVFRVVSDFWRLRAPWRSPAGLV